MYRTCPGGLKRYGSALTELRARYPSDVLVSSDKAVTLGFAGVVHDRSKSMRVVDQWGCVWQALGDEFEADGQVTGPPLVDWSALDGYRFPDPMEGREGVAEMVKVVQDDDHQHYVLAVGGTLWHRLTYLRGFENALVDVVQHREEFFYLRDSVVDFLLQRIAYLAEHEEVDGILIGDDWGTQQALMIHPSLWREIFKPAYRTLVEAIHAGGCYAHIHTDGNTQVIIPDLIEIGFDEVNPQVCVMDTEKLAEEFGGEVCFRADLDRQWILPRGSVTDVEVHVRYTRETLQQPKGGYIAYAQFGPDVPLENIEAMLRTSSTMHLG